MKMNKNAFTIPELLIFLTIVGVISVFMLTIIKPGEKYLPYAYYNAYNTLSTAVFNIREDANDLNMSDTNNTEKPEDKVFPGANNDFTTSSALTTMGRELCKKLAVDPNADSETAAQYGYINTSEYFCSTFTPIRNFSATFPDNQTPAFRASNSMLYYISIMGKLEVPDAMNNNKVQTIKYFTVWVDLNGDRRPNTAKWSPKKPADIVPFIVTTSGTVLPVGAPTIDTRYMTARVQYPTDSKRKFSVKSASYYEAQIMTYGDKEFPSYDLLSLRSSIKKVVRAPYNLIKTEINEIDKRAKLDDNCKMTENEPPVCTLIIDENTRN